MVPDNCSRPRVEGERELEILRAALEILAEVGYDRLTMDAVAHRAKASKATLYRRWESKAVLVIDALLAEKQHSPAPDTGSLRGDLLATYCGLGGLTDRTMLAKMGAVITAIGRDEEFAAAFRDQFIAPKTATSRAIFERARDRGELRDDVDLDILAPALAGIVLHRVFLHGEEPNPRTVEQVVDQIVLPAALKPATEEETRVH